MGMKKYTGQCIATTVQESCRGSLKSSQRHTILRLHVLVPPSPIQTCNDHLNLYIKRLAMAEFWVEWGCRLSIIGLE